MREVTLPDEFTHSVLTLISRTKSALTSLLHLYTIGPLSLSTKILLGVSMGGKVGKVQERYQDEEPFLHGAHLLHSTVTSRILHPVAEQNNRSVLLSAVNAGPGPRRSVKINFVDMVNKLISRMKHHSALKCHLFIGPFNHYFSILVLHIS